MKYNIWSILSCFTKVCQFSLFALISNYNTYSFLRRPGLWEGNSTLTGAYQMDTEIQQIMSSVHISLPVYITSIQSISLHHKYN